MTASADRRYEWALRMVRAKLPAGERAALDHPVVSEARVRYRLHPAQLRRLVAQLRKERSE